MNKYESVLIARQDLGASQVNTLVDELKKDENNEVVKSFIKAMASGTKEEYNKRIKEYRTNNSEKFENYMDSLNGYYYLLWKNKSIYKKGFSPIKFLFPLIILTVLSLSFALAKSTKGNLFLNIIAH